MRVGPLSPEIIESPHQNPHLSSPISRIKPNKNSLYHIVTAKYVLGQVKTMLVMELDCKCRTRTTTTTNSGHQVQSLVLSKLWFERIDWRTRTPNPKTNKLQRCRLSQVRGSNSFPSRVDFLFGVLGDLACLKGEEKTWVPAHVIGCG